MNPVVSGFPFEGAAAPGDWASVIFDGLVENTLITARDKARSSANGGSGWQNRRRNRAKSALPRFVAGQ